MTPYLVDNSVLQRLPRSEAVRAASKNILDDEHDLCYCAMTLDEFGFSVRSASEHEDALFRFRNTFLPAGVT